MTTATQQSEPSTEKPMFTMVGGIKPAPGGYISKSDVMLYLIITAVLSYGLGLFLGMAW